MTPPSEADALRARDQLAAACQNMEQLLRGLLERKTQVAKQIHTIRKLGKSLRGGLAAFGLQDHAARRIQAVNRLLSAPRDATSRTNTWRKLAWQDDPGTTGAIQNLLEHLTRSASRRPPPETIDWCVQQVASARQELLEKTTASLAADLAEGLRRLQSKTYKRCHAIHHRSKDEFHEARKAVKAWLGAISYLPEGAAGHDPSLEPLGRLLGDENDLAILAEWLKAHGFTRRIAPGLWKALGSAHDQVRTKVIREAARLQQPR